MYLLHIFMYVLVRENCTIARNENFFCVFVIAKTILYLLKKIKKKMYKLTEKIIGGMKCARSTSIKLY